MPQLSERSCLDLLHCVLHRALSLVVTPQGSATLRNHVRSSQRQFEVRGVAAPRQPFSRYYLRLLPSYGTYICRTFSRGLPSTTSHMQTKPIYDQQDEVEIMTGASVAVTLPWFHVHQICG